MNTEIEKTQENIDKENELIKKVIVKRKYFRERNRINYHKRKEAGTLKKQPSQAKMNNDYFYKTKNLKDVPTIDDIEKLKYIKPKQKLVKIDELEYKNFLEFKELSEIKNI